jgi:hypothetical protein
MIYPVVLAIFREVKAYRAKRQAQAATSQPHHHQE